MKVKIKGRNSRISFLLVLTLIVLAICSLFIGVQNLSVMDLFRLTDNQKIVLLTTRIPRTISLLLAGSTLAVSGLLMQHLTQNRFVSPTTAGTLASARLGIIISLLFFSQSHLLSKTVAAFIFSFIGTLFFTSFLKTIKLKNTVMVPLVGMMFGNVINSFSSYLAIQHELVQNTSSWLQGNFSLISSGNYQLLYLSVPLMLVISLFAHYFTIMGLGEDISTELGIPYFALELLGIVLVALATTSVLLTVGSIPFVGIVIPNLIAMKKGDHFGNILIPVALSGSVFLLVTDILSRIIIYPYEIPISVVIGVIGSITFILLLLRGEKA